MENKNKDIVFRHIRSEYGINYYADNNGWQYYQDEVNGPIRPVMTAKLTKKKWYQFWKK
jgi:hypothetical protein